MTIQIGNPLPFYTDKRGLPCDGGKLFFGEHGQDPELHPVTAYLDEALTVPVAQPVLVVGGLPTNDGIPCIIYLADSLYSSRLRDRDNAELFYWPETATAPEAFQPLDADLTAIAALSTTAYGRQLLTMANAAALRTYAGIVDSLPSTGGTISGNIVRAGAGSHLYHTDAANTSGRVFITASGAPDPTSLPGDVWLELAP